MTDLTSAQDFLKIPIFSAPSHTWFVPDKAGNNTQHLS